MSMSLKAGANGNDYQPQTRNDAMQTADKRSSNNASSHQQQKQFDDILERRRREAQSPDTEQQTPVPLQSLMQISSMFEAQSSTHVEAIVPRIDTIDSIKAIEAIVSQFWLRDPSLNVGSITCPIVFASGFSVPVSLSGLSEGGVQIVLHVTPDEFIRQSGLDARELAIFLQERFPKRRICVDLKSEKEGEESDAG